jgi:hypothetical protein
MDVDIAAAEDRVPTALGNSCQYSFFLHLYSNETHSFHVILFSLAAAMDVDIAAAEEKVSVALASSGAVDAARAAVRVRTAANSKGASDFYCS